MSTRIVIPGPTLNEFRSTFNKDFPYLHSRWRDHIVLESFEGVRFQFPLDVVIHCSPVFAHASSLAHKDHGHVRPVVMTFASTPGLRYLLLLLRQSYCSTDDTASRNKVLKASGQDTAAAIRIAHILDTPLVGRAILARTDIDVYMRYVVEHTFETPSPTDRDVWLSPLGVRVPPDLSFILHPQGHFQRSIQLLQEINPSAVRNLATFHHHRSTAISVLKQWLITGIPLGRVLRSDRRSQFTHRRACKASRSSEVAFTRRLPNIVPKAMALLAKSKSKAERLRNIGALLAREAKGCSGCLTRLESVYMPALRSFDAAFPAMPK